VHFVKKHYLQCNTGEVTKTFSLLNRAWCVLTIRVFAVLQGALPMPVSASQNEGKAWRRCIGEPHREVSEVSSPQRQR